jgi:hypothetical protein
VAAGKGFEGVDEYDPVGDDHYNLPANAARAVILADSSDAGAGGTILIQHWTATEKSLRVTLREPERLALRLLNYPAWRVEVNGSLVVPENATDSGQMVLELPAGESGVTVRLVRTTDRTLGGILSLLSVLFALVWITRTSGFVRARPAAAA